MKYFFCLLSVFLFVNVATTSNHHNKYSRHHAKRNHVSHHHAAKHLQSRGGASGGSAQVEIGGGVSLVINAEASAVGIIKTGANAFSIVFVGAEAAAGVAASAAASVLAIVNSSTGAIILVNVYTGIALGIEASASIAANLAVGADLQAAVAAIAQVIVSNAASIPAALGLFTSGLYFNISELLGWLLAAGAQTAGAVSTVLSTKYALKRAILNFLRDNFVNLFVAVGSLLVQAAFGLKFGVLILLGAVLDLASDAGLLLFKIILALYLKVKFVFSADLWAKIIIALNQIASGTVEAGLELLGNIAGVLSLVGTVYGSVSAALAAVASLAVDVALKVYTTGVVLGGVSLYFVISILENGSYVIDIVGDTIVSIFYNYANNYLAIVNKALKIALIIVGATGLVVAYNLALGVGIVINVAAKLGRLVQVNVQEIKDLYEAADIIGALDLIVSFIGDHALAAGTAIGGAVFDLASYILSGSAAADIKSALDAAFGAVRTIAAGLVIALVGITTNIVYSLILAILGGSNALTRAILRVLLYIIERLLGLFNNLLMYHFLKHLAAAIVGNLAGVLLGGLLLALEAVTAISGFLGLEAAVSYILSASAIVLSSITAALGFAIELGVDGCICAP